MAIFLGGLFALYFGLDGQTETARWAARFGAALALATLAFRLLKAARKGRSRAIASALSFTVAI
jgi:hypothetical protein